MKDAGEERRFGVDLKKLPPLYPTHGHSPIFWENLGRTIATFGFLEEVLGKAIFHSPQQLYMKKVKLTPPTKNGYRLSKEL